MHGKTSLPIVFISIQMKSTSLKSVEFEIWPMYTIKLNTNFQYLNEKSRDSIRKDIECKFRHEEYVLRCHILTNLEVILSNVSRHLSLSLEITYPRTSTTLTRFTDLSIAQADPKASSNSKAKPSIPLTTLESSSSYSLTHDFLFARPKRGTGKSLCFLNESKPCCPVWI